MSIVCEIVVNVVQDFLCLFGLCGSEYIYIVCVQIHVYNKSRGAQYSLISPAGSG